MTLLDILGKAAGIPVATLRALILAGAKVSPELAAEAGKLVAWMDAAVTPEGLMKLGAAIFTEAQDISQGAIHPKDHPSDAA